jgi:hypothetical protein
MTGAGSDRIRMCNTAFRKTETTFRSRFLVLITDHLTWLFLAGAKVIYMTNFWPGIKFIVEYERISKPQDRLLT